MVESTVMFVTSSKTFILHGLNVVVILCDKIKYFVQILDQILQYFSQIPQLNKQRSAHSNVPVILTRVGSGTSGGLKSMRPYFLTDFIEVVEGWAMAPLTYLWICYWASYFIKGYNAISVPNDPVQFLSFSFSLRHESCQIIGICPKVRVRVPVWENLDPPLNTIVQK